ncbi:hypothetical protein F5148DRAFT_1325294 [Russula earlei]|uniref:Uncharacterized protein n=1 Tax=Russula earlei TaxID=71964 RepID=A0ACC0TZN7_9AGAM|nr:hypothetical protein F5148DRAFT_1325294 [Russula earlei]
MTCTCPHFPRVLLPFLSSFSLTLTFPSRRRPHRVPRSVPGNCDNGSRRSPSTSLALPLLQPHVYARTHMTRLSSSSIHTEAAKLWARVFSEQLSQEDLSTVMRVAENTLNNWRSEMGKAGYRVVSQTFSNSNLFPHAVDREEYVADALRDLTFVYKHPDDKASRGAFCSRLVAEVYSQHLKKISGVSHDYGKQVGALALATAAAERGLTLFQTGEDALRTGRETDGRARGLGFTESAWGDKTRDLVKSTRKLQDSHWAAILGECSVFLHYHLQETEQEWCLAGEETEGFERVRPHAHIDITW